VLLRLETYNNGTLATGSVHRRGSRSDVVVQMFVLSLQRLVAEYGDRQEPGGHMHDARLLLRHIKYQTQAVQGSTITWINRSCQDN